MGDRGRAVLVKITRKSLVEKRLLVCRRIVRVDTQRLRCQLMVKLKKVAVEEDEESMSLDAVIANPTDLRNRLDVQFVVDTGASMTAITLEMAKSLGLGASLIRETLGLCGTDSVELIAVMEVQPVRRESRNEENTGAEAAERGCEYCECS